MRKRIIRGGLAFLAFAAVAAALVIPYYRQLLFGPTCQGVPLCVWQDQIRRQTLGDSDPDWLAKLRKWFQPKKESVDNINLTREDRIAIWLTLLDDRVPAVRSQAIHALWGTGPWGHQVLWGSDVLVFSGDTGVINLSTRYQTIESYHRALIFDGGWSAKGGTFSPAAVQPPPPVAPHLIRMLDDDSADVRQTAFQALGAQGREAAPAFPRLFEFLQDADPVRRAHAARALNSTHPKTRSWLDRLIALLDDDNVDVRLTVADGLSTWSDQRMAVAAGPRLVQALRDPEPTVRIASAATLGALRVHRREATEALRAGLRHGDAAVRNRTLGALSAPTGADLFPELVRAARSDPDSNLRTAAVGALWYGGEQAVPVLIPFLRHPNADVRNAAVQSLRNLGPKARLAVPYLLADLDSFAGQGVQALADIRDADAVPRLIELLAHRDLRGTALSALQTIGPDAHAALPRLLEVLDEQADLRTQALQAILTIGANDENVMAALERRVLTEFAARRDDLVWPFCQNSDRAHVLVPALIKRLREDVPKSCVAHVQALGAIGSPARDAVPVLLRFGREVNYELRSSAINALCSIAAGEREVVPWLIEQLDHDQHADSAVSALAQFGARAESARPHLLPFLKSARPEWRSAAISALAAIGPPEVVAEDLMPLLRDREESVRITASQALCSLGPTNQLEQVIALLRDEQPAVRNAVARALRDLGPSAAAAVPALSALLDDDSQTTFDTALEALARIEP